MKKGDNSLLKDKTHLTKKKLSQFNDKKLWCMYVYSIVCVKIP